MGRKAYGRTFEIDHRGKRWLAEREVKRFEQEFDHRLFSAMMDMGYAYSSGSKPETRIITRQLNSGETPSPYAKPTSTPPPRWAEADVATVKQRSSPDQQPTQVPLSRSVPAHLRNRTKKKDWFN